MSLAFIPVKKNYASNNYFLSCRVFIGLDTYTYKCYIKMM